jgi:hypothetical protein
MLLPGPHSCMLPPPPPPAAGVAVHAGGRVFEADAAVVTVPLGVLKRGGIAFNPPLPQRKLAAISRLGFGVLNKVGGLGWTAGWPPQAVQGKLPSFWLQPGSLLQEGPPSACWAVLSGGPASWLVGSHNPCPTSADAATLTSCHARHCRAALRCALCRL